MKLIFARTLVSGLYVCPIVDKVMYVIRPHGLEDTPPQPCEMGDCWGIARFHGQTIAVEFLGRVLSFNASGEAQKKALSLISYWNALSLDRDEFARYDIHYTWEHASEYLSYTKCQIERVFIDAGIPVFITMKQVLAFRRGLKYVLHMQGVATL